VPDTAHILVLPGGEVLVVAGVQRRGPPSALVVAIDRLAGELCHRAGSEQRADVEAIIDCGARARVALLVGLPDEARAYLFAPAIARGPARIVSAR